MATLWQPYSNHLGKLFCNLWITLKQPHVNLRATLLQPCQPLQPHGNFLETSHKFLVKFLKISRQRWGKFTLLGS